MRIRIEGNADERGSDEYNLALGQRRAASAKRYLVDHGIAADRFDLVSYGEERPVCTEHNEACWQQNRRDDFRIVTIGSDQHKWSRRRSKHLLWPILERGSVRD